ncbi:MAG TPA: class I SAM-dependent methyltransferase [Candidatus Binataceae bacterium]|nr:class I SAM-dependent methyltransferase [Candidatus Binataceae bacterium]
MASWWEDDEFWKAFGSYFFTPDRVGRAAAEVEALVELLAITPGAKVLDLCCGIGRHSVEFARLGYTVTAVDLTAAFLARARKRAEREKVNLEFVQSDMRDFFRPAAFDAAVNLVTSFGYFEDQADDLRVARNLCESVKPGGRLAMELMGKEALARKFVERRWDTTTDGTLILMENKMRSGWYWIETRWIIIKGADRRELNFSTRLYSAAELGALLKQAGFQKVEFFGNFDGAPYDQNAERLVVVATK